MMTPLVMLPSPCSPNINCISCLKPCYCISYSVSIIAAWGGWKWCGRQCRRHGTSLQWSKKVFNACVRSSMSIDFQNDWLDEFFRSPYLTAIPGFSSVGNWKTDNDVPW